jgi:hypothetical protein
MDGTNPRSQAGISVVPANEASWDDLRIIFGTRGDPSSCQCQWFKIQQQDWSSVPVGELAERLRQQSGCGNPAADSTSGLVAYLDGEPAGWCAVEPRAAYLRLLRARVPWTGRMEDKGDDGVWAVTCFVTRTSFRRRASASRLATSWAGGEAPGRGREGVASGVDDAGSQPGRDRVFAASVALGSRVTTRLRVL